MSAVAAPVRTDALVAGVRACGAYAVLALQSPEIARTARPGQFVNVGLEPESSHLLRRPFSIYRVHPDDDLVEIAFDVVGPGTRWIAARRSCTNVDVVGPLGTGFTPLSTQGTVVMVGGGYGSSALFQLGHELHAEGRRTVLITGAATARRVFGTTEARDCFDETIVATEDGSAGVRGLVTDALQALLGKETPAAVYACGPMPMLAAVAQMSTSVPTCEVAAEEFMACGVGVCWTCVVPVRTGEGVKHVRCCTEGPVFDGAVVEWR